MRRSTYAAVVLVSSTVALAGCAALSGLDGISEQACAPDCGDSGTTDGTVTATGPDGTPGFDVTPSSDHTAPDDTTTTPLDDSTTGEDAPTSEDASDSMTPDAGEDAATDTGTDTGSEDAGMDATPDAGEPDTGCGPLTSIDNCSACGDVCTATNATAPECNGATCSYTCKANYLDCNASTAPDTDGCECNAPGATAAQCCLGSCPIAHEYDEDLTDSTFYVCVAQGTYNETLALAACATFTGDESQCDYIYSFTCSTGADGGGTFLGDMVCANGSTTKNCNCWGYDDSIKGLMSTGTGIGNDFCGCPQSGGTQWK